MNTNYSIFIASFYACTAACSFREASFLNSFQSYKIHSFKIVCISSIRFLRQWSFTTCSVDGSGKPCLDIDHCVMLGKASVNMFIVFSSLLNNQWILISPSIVRKFKCRVWNTLNLLICSISNSSRFSNAQFFFFISTEQRLLCRDLMLWWGYCLRYSSSYSNRAKFTLLLFLPFLFS